MDADPGCKIPRYHLRSRICESTSTFHLQKKTGRILLPSSSIHVSELGAESQGTREIT